MENVIYGLPKPKDWMGTTRRVRKIKNKVAVAMVKKRDCQNHTILYGEKMAGSGEKR